VSPGPAEWLSDEDAQGDDDQAPLYGETALFDLPRPPADSLWHTCACGCPAAPSGECTCSSLCPCDVCDYCDRNATPWSNDLTTLVEVLRCSPGAREAIEGAVSVIEGYDVAFVVHDMAALGTDDHADDCAGCLMLSDLAADYNSRGVTASRSHDATTPLNTI